MDDIINIKKTEDVMNKKHLYHIAPAYRQGELVDSNYKFKCRCSKDVRVVVGRGKCLKCELNNGFGEDLDGKFVYCSYLSK
jgi:hypothetical protein